MASRSELHEELCSILGTPYAYFQPPATIRMSYPCIKYSLTGADHKRANDSIYKNTRQYEVIVIDHNPDSDIHENILTHFQMCRFDRSYVADNLNHFVLTLYY